MSELIRGQELAEKVLEQVTRYPESHFQATWVSWPNEPVGKGECGTVACLAGWAVTLNANPGETPRQALERVARELNHYPSWEVVAAELLLPEGDNDRTDDLRDIFHVMGERGAVMDFAAFFDLEVSGE